MWSDDCHLFDTESDYNILWVNDLHMLVINWDFHGYFSYMSVFPVRETLTNLDETLKS